MQLLLIILNNILCTVVYLIMYCCISYYVVLHTILCGSLYCCISYYVLLYVVVYTVLLLYTLASLTRFTPGKTFTPIPVIQPFSFDSQLQ